MSAHPRTHSTPAGTLLIYPDRASACQFAAQQIATVIQEARASRGQAVLGLATGSTPVQVYKKLVEQVKAGDLSLDATSTYNLDEYYPISPLDPQSYHAFMHQHLLAHAGLPPHQTHILDGTVPEAFVPDHCAEFERWIQAQGGLDLQLLGIGRNGHIGFNEPVDLSVEEALKLPTRLVSLHPVTLDDAKGDFGGQAELVPKRALTMGISTILAARSILILAFGAAKAPAVARAIQGPPSATLPASLLQTVANRVTWLVDDAAAAELAL